MTCPSSLMYHLSDACHVAACNGMTYDMSASLMYHLIDVCHVAACNGMTYDMPVIVDVSSQ